jgi:hypothetical protein
MTANDLLLSRERRASNSFRNELDLGATTSVPLVGCGCLLGRSNPYDLEVRVGGLDPDDRLMKARNLRNQANFASFVV